MSAKRERGPRAPCYPESRRSDWGRGSLFSFSSLHAASLFAYRRFVTLLLQNFWHPGYAKTGSNTKKKTSKKGYNERVAEKRKHLQKISRTLCSKRSWIRYLLFSSSSCLLHPHSPLFSALTASLAIFRLIGPQGRGRNMLPFAGMLTLLSCALVLLFAEQAGK